MSVLRTIEQKIEGLFEGVFGRAFRTNVQPVELARKLAKEMDEHRTISVSRIYVPNEYTIYLSPPDREQFESYEGSLIGELQDYLGEHARREQYALLTQPTVLLKTDEDLTIGEFGIATRMVQPEGSAPRAPSAGAPEAGATMIYTAAEPVHTEAVSAAELGLEPETMTLALEGKTHELTTPRAVLGRSKDCEIQLADPNASRRHAEVRLEDDAYWLIDLDSTNGTELNGKRVDRGKLAVGDRITIGETEIVFGRKAP